LTNPASPNYNWAQLLNRRIPTYECPSSSWSPTPSIQDMYGTSYNPSGLGAGYSPKSTMEVGSYVCIMGASNGGGVDNTGGSYTPSGTWWQDPTGANRCAFMPGYTWGYGGGPSQSNCYFGGVVCSNGAFTWKTARTFAQISDGLSNTLLIAEESGLMNYPAGSCAGVSGTQTRPANAAWNGGVGIYEGDPAATVPTTTTTPAGGTAPGAETTLRWPVNTLTKQFGSDGLGWAQYNNGINSSHPGGANALRGDGSVSFLSQNVPYNVIMLMSIIDDGQVFADP
jgi:prepilin-type processing-associated H-X9-DG protein